MVKFSVTEIHGEFDSCKDVHTITVIYNSVFLQANFP